MKSFVDYWVYDDDVFYILIDIVHVKFLVFIFYYIYVTHFQFFLSTDIYGTCRSSYLFISFSFSCIFIKLFLNMFRYLNWLNIFNYLLMMVLIVFNNFCEFSIYFGDLYFLENNLETIKVEFYINRKYFKR